MRSVKAEYWKEYMRARIDGKSNAEAHRHAKDMINGTGWTRRGNIFKKMGRKNDPSRKKAMEQRMKYLRKRSKTKRGMA